MVRKPLIDDLLMLRLLWGSINASLWSTQASEQQNNLSDDGGALGGSVYPRP